MHSSCQRECGRYVFDKLYHRQNFPPHSENSTKKHLRNPPTERHRRQRPVGRFNPLPAVHETEWCYAIDPPATRRKSIPQHNGSALPSIATSVVPNPSAGPGPANGSGIDSGAGVLEANPKTLRVRSREQIDQSWPWTVDSIRQAGRRQCAHTWVAGEGGLMN